MKKLVMVVEFEDRVTIHDFEEFGKVLQGIDGVKQVHTAEIPERLLTRRKLVMEEAKAVY